MNERTYPRPVVAPNLREVLKRVESDPRSPALVRRVEFNNLRHDDVVKQFAPKSEEERAATEGAPEYGAFAYRNISTFGEACATHIEDHGKAVANAVVKYQQECTDAAARIRDLYRAEATRAMDFTKRLDKALGILGSIEDVFKR